MRGEGGQAGLPELSESGDARGWRGGSSLDGWVVVGGAVSIFRSQPPTS